MQTHRPPRILFALLLPLLLSARDARRHTLPGTKELLARAEKLAGAPGDLFRRWKEPFLARVRMVRKKRFLVSPPITPNLLCRDFQQDPLVGPELAGKITDRAARAFRPGKVRFSRFLPFLFRLTRRGRAALGEKDRKAASLPPGDMEGLKILLTRLHRAWKETLGTWKKASKARPVLEETTDRFIRHIYIHSGLPPARLGAVSAVLSTAGKGDPSRLLSAAGSLLQALMDPVWRKNLAGKLTGFDEIPAGEGVTGKVLLDEHLPFGRIVVGGPGKNTYDCGKVPFVVDLGGDDTYRGPAGGAAGPARPLSMVLDLAGNDTYLAGPSGGQGSGFLGAGILVDAGGDDTYRGGRRCQGFALCGAGVLADLGGNDVYEGHELCQGAALFGTGLLLDLSGKDVYTARLYAQGFGGPGGTGLLADREGKDRFVADSHYPSYYPEDAKRGQHNAMSQGTAVGFRGIADGGTGILLDGGGDDFHRVGQFSCGGAYFFGVGIVRDMAGRDEYQVARYGGAFAPHQAVGVLMDDEGDDIYTGRGTACLAGTWDTSLAYLLDREGNDRYTGVGITLGGATIGSFSFFLDGNGSDVYRVRGGDRTALGSGGHPQDLKLGTYSLGVFLDLGKGKDRFSFTGKAAHPRAPGRAAWWEVKPGKGGKTAGFGLFLDEEE